MKKILLLMFIAMAFVSCADNSPKGKVEKAFKDYVSKNFDDPKSLKEIVSIDVNDTINIHNIIYYTGELIMVCDKKDSLCESTYNAITNAIKGTNEIKRNHRVKEKYDKYISAVNKRRDSFIWRINKKDGFSYKDNLKSMIKNTRNSDTIFICSEIKYRNIENGDIKLKSIYALHDTLYNNIDIYKDKFDVNEYVNKKFRIENLENTAKDIMKLAELYNEEYLQSIVIRALLQTELGIIVE